MSMGASPSGPGSRPPGGAASASPAKPSIPSAFTPGPWEARDTCSQQERWVVGADHPYSSEHRLTVAREIETEANARLIAAAPELYEALEAARREIVFHLRGNEALIKSSAAIYGIDAILAKARGEQ
jgi:hypothetical protein